MTNSFIGILISSVVITIAMIFFTVNLKKEGRKDIWDTLIAIILLLLVCVIISSAFQINRLPKISGVNWIILVTHFVPFVAGIILSIWLSVRWKAKSKCAAICSGFFYLACSILYFCLSNFEYANSRYIVEVNLSNTMAAFFGMISATQLANYVQLAESIKK